MWFELIWKFRTCIKLKFAGYQGAKMFGWIGKILLVNLSTGKVKEEKFDLRTLKDYSGGRGLGIHYLNKFVDPKCDPLSTENMIVVATGPLTGREHPPVRATW